MVVFRHPVPMFFSGLLMGCVVIAGAWFAAGHVNSNLPVAQSGQITGAGPPSEELPTVSICPLQAALAKAGDKDGRFPFQADLSGLTATEIASFVVIGKEAVSAGRLRDAETAFLMSCRVADKFKGADSVESAESKYLLGGLYAKAGTDGEPDTAANAAELLWRAQFLYADSLNAYIKSFGRTGDKSRSAFQALVAVQQSIAQLQTLLPSAATSQSGQEQATASNKAARRLADDTTTMQARAASGPQTNAPGWVKAPPPSTRVSRTAARGGPNFNCNKAGSVPEKLICSDPELARLDRELSRIYLEAKKATSDRAAFRHIQDREWLKRESTCRDRICLLGWYSDRRAQLLTDQKRRSLPKPTAVR